MSWQPLLCSAGRTAASKYAKPNVYVVNTAQRGLAFRMSVDNVCGEASAIRLSASDLNPEI
jgi:hypothetical protein